MLATDINKNYKSGHQEQYSNLMPSQYPVNSGEKYAHADGDSEDEDNTDFENSDASDVGGVDAEVMPKFRQLVRMKKNELKEKYGKSHHIGKKKSCSNTKGLSDAAYIALLPTSAITNPQHCKGWRSYWKDFKKSGGLLKLKTQSQNEVKKEQEKTENIPDITAETQETKSSANIGKIALIGGVAVAVLLGLYIGYVKLVKK